MSYAPNNVNVYTAAFAGAMAGMAEFTRNNVATTIDYSTTASIAGAFAQQFDTQWGANPVDNLQLEEIAGFCEGVWEGRAPQILAKVGKLTVLQSPYTNPLIYQPLVAGMIAAITASETYFSSQGITPPALPITGLNMFSGSTPLAGNPQTALAVTGSAVTFAIVSGVPTVTVNDSGDGLSLSANGTPLTGNPQTQLNVTGTGMTLSLVMGVPTLNIPPAFNLEAGGVALTGNPQTIMNVTGAGASLTLVGGVPTLNIPGSLAMSAGGTPLSGNPQTSFNVTGNGATLTEVASVATLNIPGNNAPSLTTTAIAAVGSGAFGYISATDTISPTDNATMTKSRCIGAYEGTPNQMTTLAGTIIPDALFTTAGGAPSVGAPVYLANATDDTNTGAGKLTATAPTIASSPIVVALVGYVLDASNYAGSKTCSIVFQPGMPIQL